MSTISPVPVGPSNGSGDGALWANAQTPGDQAARKPACGAPLHSRPVHPADGLVTMVESEIIPRLMLAHRTKAATVPALPDIPRVIGPETTEAFARMVVSKEPDSLIAFVGDLLQAGASLDTIYMELIVPAARRLGDYWDEDSVSFTDVTVGLGRLHQVVRALGWKTPSHADQRRLSRSAFFAPGPNEQHMLGLFIVEDFFRRAGWRTWVDATATTEDLTDTVKGHWFDVFGMSVSVDSHVDEVAANIRAIRRASRNPGIFVLVGGRLFLEQPELVSVVKADATATSGGEALLIANHALLIADDAGNALPSPA